MMLSDETDGLLGQLVSALVAIYSCVTIDLDEVDFGPLSL